MRIGVHVFFYAESLPCRFKHYAYVYVQTRSFSCETFIVRILHETPCPFFVIGADPFCKIFRVEIFDAIVASLKVHLSLRLAVLVQDSKPGNSCKPCHLGVICTESRSYMHYARTVLGRHIIARDYTECPLIWSEPRNQLFVAHSDELSTLERAGNKFVLHFGKPAVHEFFCEYICCRLARIGIRRLYFYIIYVGSDAERGVGCESPWSRGP